LEDINCEVAATGQDWFGQIPAAEAATGGARRPAAGHLRFSGLSADEKDPLLQGVPVVMVSGRFTEVQDRIQGMELGRMNFTPNPLIPASSFSRIKNLIRTTHSEASAQPSTPPAFYIN